MSAIHHHNWHDFDRNHLRNTALRLVVAAGVILVAHTAAVYAMLHWRSDEVVPAEAAAIMIELAPMPTSVAADEPEVAPGPQMMQSLAEPTPEAPDTPEEVAPPPEPMVEEMVEKLPELPPTEAKSEVVLPEPPPEKKEKPKEKPKPKPVQKPKPDARETRRQRAEATSAAPRSNAPTAQATAAPSAGLSASNSRSVADWQSRVKARFASQKRYPPGAPSGMPSIYMRVGPGGQLLSVSLTRSSGVPVLDAEALAMARRGAPYPPAPPGVPGGNFPLNVRFNRN